MNGHGGQATSLRTGTRMDGGGEDGGEGGGGRMERIKRDGRDVSRSSTLISSLLFVAVGTEFPVPWVVFLR